MKPIIVTIVSTMFQIDLMLGQSLWQPTNGPFTGGVRSAVVALSQDSAGNILAGSRGGVAEIFKSTNDGLDWTRVLADSNNMGFRSIACGSDGRVYVGSWSRGVFLSLDGGTTWSRSNNGLTNYQINCITLDQAGTVYAASPSGVFRSSDRGQNWEAMKEGLSDTVVEVISASPSGLLYVGTRHGGIFRSRDLGLHWQKCSNGLVISQVLSMTTNSQGHVFADQEGWGVYRSTDEGDSWVCVGPSLCGPMLAMTANSLDHIFASACNGVFRTTNNGKDWSDVGSGLPQGEEALLAKSDGVLFAGGSGPYGGTGVYRTSNSTTSVNGQSTGALAAFRLNQNYPNPFNPATTIEYDLFRTTRVSLIVYNMLGEQVASLTDGVLDAGHYAQQFVPRDLSSGVYYYKLRAGGLVLTRKMLILQ